MASPYSDELVQRFRSKLSETGNAAATARALGITEDVARNVVKHHPELRELFAPRGAHVRTHGMWGTPEWATWSGMRTRCNVATNKDFPKYGARGIRVCARWNASFDAFFADMGGRPTPLHSLDRRDNDGNYSCGKCDECIASGWPANCRWATKREQARNRSSVVRLAIDGVEKSLVEWSESAGIPAHLFHKRVFKRGWHPRDALARPRAYVRRAVSA